MTSSTYFSFIGWVSADQVKLLQAVARNSGHVQNWDPSRTDAKRRATARNWVASQCTSKKWLAHETKRNELQRNELSLFRFVAVHFVSFRFSSVQFISSMCIGLNRSDTGRRESLQRPLLWFRKYQHLLCPKCLVSEMPVCLIKAKK